MSVTYFTAFSPEIFQVEIKNKFLAEKYHLFFPKYNQNKLKDQFTTEYNIDNKSKMTYFRTTTNFNKINNNKNIRDLISPTRIIKSKKPIKKHKYILSQAFGEKVQPYKQYILEKRQLENIKNEKIRYKLYLQNQNDLSSFPPKKKIKGVNFSKQKDYGFFDQIAESKNYSKVKTNNIPKKHIFHNRKIKYDEIDMDLLEDLKANKKKNVFEENFNVKFVSKYDKLRHNYLSFMKSLRENPNYNY